MGDGRRDWPADDSIARYLPYTSIAYLSMEIAIRPEIPTYSGGLGILAGDAARTAADLGLPMVFVCLASRDGYLQQELRQDRGQVDAPDPWDPRAFARPLPAMVAVEIERRAVWVRPWLYALQGISGGAVPVLLLDTDLAENQACDRSITGRLYGGDQADRLRQEIVLGIGGERLLAALGFNISTYHLNEGHAALLPLTLLRRYPLRPAPPTGPVPYDTEPVLERCVFTTHTPVEAGHDRFPYDLVHSVLGDPVGAECLQALAGPEALNMTLLALNLSGYVNGVARRQRETASRMFPGYPIRAISNGVHPETWVHPAFARLYDGIGPHWRYEPEILSRARDLSPEALLSAHREAKQALLTEVRARTGRTLDPERPIVAFARRMTAYKRPGLVFEDRERLLRIAADRPFQFVFAGKAHPHDEAGKELIRRIGVETAEIGERLPIVFVPGYDFNLAKALVAGSDIWLNTPLPPLEASGTSGMKAALNGVPQLSVLDGWWAEGCVEGRNGWAIGTADGPADEHGSVLLDKLEHVVLPLFHRDHQGWARVMAGAIAETGALFTSHRMMRRYAAEAYLGSGRPLNPWPAPG